jgi:hypothetical protein
MSGYRLRFAAPLRALQDGTATRRSVACGLAGLLVAAGFPSGSGGAPAKNRRKRKRRHPPVNEFGCRDVGVACTGADRCCSGVCAGKRGKKRCQAHDTGGCELAQDSCSGTNFACTTTTGNPGFCHVTTGNAPYCALDGVDAECTKDADCVPFCGPLAACAVCAEPGQAPFRFCASPDSCPPPL